MHSAIRVLLSEQNALQSRIGFEREALEELKENETKLKQQLANNTKALADIKQAIVDLGGNPDQVSLTPSVGASVAVGHLAS